MDINPIKVNYKSTSILQEARSWLKELEQKELITCDFELAIKYTEEERKKLEAIRDNENTDYVERKQAMGALSATALDHPAHSVFTHCSIAWSDHDAYVFILDSFELSKEVLTFLNTTTVKQVWFNASYDFLRLYYHTGKMPINYEDAQIYARLLFNHTDSQKFKLSLKGLAGAAYGDWGLSADYFDLSYIHDPTMIRYAATDACATFWVWERILNSVEDSHLNYPDTVPAHTPWSLLPAPIPMESLETESYFYHMVGKHVIRDTVRMMDNGLPIDLKKVRELEKHLVEVIEEVKNGIENNKLVQDFLVFYNQEIFDNYKADLRNKMRSAMYYQADFDSRKAEHRNFYMYVFSKTMNMPTPAVPEGALIPNWSAVLVGKLGSEYPALMRLRKHEVIEGDKYASEAMALRAEMKAAAYNKTYLEKINQPLESFIETSALAIKELNPNSTKQLRSFFSWCGEESEATSEKTGEDSWNREQVERLHKSTEDEDIKSFTHDLIDHSFAAIVKNNFIEAFYRYTVDGVLHGNMRLFGAKTGRFTSNKPLYQGLYKRNFISKSA